MEVWFECSSNGVDLEVVVGVYDFDVGGDSV